MNAKLPESMEQRNTIENMEIGESKYVVPWAMWADSDRRLWLISDYPTEDEPGGTVEMRIIRIKEGFRVLPVPGYTYDVESGGGHGLPVVELDTES